MEANDSAAKAPTEPAAEWVARARLKPFAGNPRRNQATIPVVADSIVRFGFGAPIVARRSDGVILAGHARFGATELLIKRYEKATSRERTTWHADAIRVATEHEVVVRFVDLDEHDSKLYTIADNRIGETLSETDDEMLAALLRDLKASDVDVIAGTGLSDEAVAKLLGEDPAEGGTGGDPGDGRYQSQFGVIVLCTDEAEQQRIYDSLKTEGYNCKVVVT